MYFFGTCNESLVNSCFITLWIWSCFCVNREEISFPCPDFVDSEVVTWGLISLTDFHKRIHLLFKKRHVQPINWKVVLFLVDINSKGIVFSKLISQLKLLPSLSEFQDNDTIVISTIRKDCKAFYLHKQTDAKNDGIFSALKHVKAYLGWTKGNHMGKQPTARSNVGACSH